MADWEEGAEGPHDLDDEDSEEDQELEQDLEALMGVDEGPISGEGPFPSDEYLALAESLTQLHVANFAPARLAEAVTAAGERARAANAVLRPQLRGVAVPPRPGRLRACVAQLSAACLCSSSLCPARASADNIFRARRRCGLCAIARVEGPLARLPCCWRARARSYAKGWVGYCWQRCR